MLIILWLLCESESCDVEGGVVNDCTDCNEIATTIAAATKRYEYEYEYTIIISCQHWFPSLLLFLLMNLSSRADTIFVMGRVHVYVKVQALSAGLNQNQDKKILLHIHFLSASLTRFIKVGRR